MSGLSSSIPFSRPLPVQVSRRLAVRSSLYLSTVGFSVGMVVGVMGAKIGIIGGNGNWGGRLSRWPRLVVAVAAFGCRGGRVYRKTALQSTLRVNADGI